MNYYAEIVLLPDPEFPGPILMNALFSKLHRALVQSNSDDVGISFPDISTNQMGKMLRIHGHKPVLDTLMNSSRLDGVRDHVALGKISPVPSGTNTVAFSVCRQNRMLIVCAADINAGILSCHPNRLR